MSINITDDATQFPANVRAPSTGDLFSFVRTAFGQDLANRTAWLKRLTTFLGVPRIRFGTAAAMVALTGNSDGDVFLVTSFSSPLGMGLYVFDSTLSQGAGVLQQPPFLVNAAAGGGAWKHSLLGMLGTWLPYSGSDGRVSAAQLEICTSNVDSANRVAAANVKNGVVYANGVTNGATASTSSSTTIASFAVPNLQVGDFVFVSFAGNTSKASASESAQVVAHIAGSPIANAIFSSNSGGNADTSTSRSMSCSGAGVVAAAGTVTVDVILNSGAGSTVSSSSNSFSVFVYRP